ncbi:M14 family metallopeptidase [Pedobacter sp. PAMC26386]|nr:M14 family metallopeptidase [Pedobacter sp. PAMC26386]
MKYSLLFLILTLTMKTFAQQTPYELSNKNQTATYQEAIDFYTQLAKTSPQAKFLSYGSTDFGKPLNLLILSKHKIFDPAEIRKNKLSILLINNGIHPGEPEGIDASMMLARDLLKDNHLPDNVVICIIPIYNIDGAFNRSSTSRANQNGPDFYGFRGNSKNYDLNRDFIKTDSRNSAAFQEIFNTWRPEIFVDTHTSNGADYQYTMTLIPTQKDKLNPILASYLTETMVPALYSEMKKKGFELIPYINSIENTPDAGITGFLETPRYSTGYAALHNTIGFMPETHMLKAYQKRVESTYQLLQTYVALVNRDAKIIGQNKLKADQATSHQSDFPISWKLNETTHELLAFKGFTAKYKPSAVSGADRLYYDRNEPYTKNIKYWNKFDPELTVKKPQAYVIPKAWDKVIGLLKLNGVKMDELKEDKELAVDVYYIADYKTASRPYEGHYIHNSVELSTKKQTLKFYKGDYLVYVNQPQNRYIVETLEPQATDSFFNWNFFDSILDQKEHYSPYVFEDTAAELLKDNPDLRTKLNQKKISDSAFAQNPSAQLEFVYKNSNYYEKTHLRYPIARLH